MLFKRTTPTARAAQLGLVPLQQDNLAPEENDDLSLAGSPASLQDAELARLAEDNAWLRDELAQLQQRWDIALSEAEVRGCEMAARQHVTDDAAFLAALTDALAGARSDFAAGLDRGAGQLAAALAQDALSRLVNAARDENEWLARVIARRLGDLRRKSVVALRLAPQGDSDSVLADLCRKFAPDIPISVDPRLPRGTARIELNLGEITINPADGLQQVLAMLGDGDDANAV
ncbi:MAG: hypothetical protein ABL926_00445 [Novosphingobium sp.]|uniref:hypothetical protein n=1 Tax=Novosphingobium sp. TaxID=1874826 RepID=UPI0032B75998